MIIIKITVKIMMVTTIMIMMMVMIIIIPVLIIITYYYLFILYFVSHYLHPIDTPIYGMYPETIPDAGIKARASSEGYGSLDQVSNHISLDSIRPIALVLKEPWHGSVFTIRHLIKRSISYP